MSIVHYQGIIHRDIKPANLLWTRDHTVKISDFGVSYFNQHLVGSNNAYNEEMDRELAETAGTPAFFAPELCSSIEINQHDDRHITKAIDVWALGVTLYCLIYGQCPFTASTEFELFDMIPTAPLVFPTEDEIGFSTPDSLKDLLQGLLTKDPDHRMTLAQVKQHAWVLQDLEDVEGWWKEADPTRYKTVQVTEEDVSRAFTLMDRLKRSIRRISSSFSNLTQGFARHHHRPALTAPTTSSSLSSSSSLSLLSMTAEPHPTLQQQQQQQQQQQHSKDDNGGWIPTSFTQMTLHHPASSSSEESLRESRTAAVPNTLYPHPFQIDRNDSSGSSMSGLVVTFSRAKTASDTNKKSA
jgi:serine/threonine protein kinase